MSRSEHLIKMSLESPETSPRQSQKSFLSRHKWKIFFLLIFLVLCGTVFILMLNGNIISLSDNDDDSSSDTENDEKYQWIPRSESTPLHLVNAGFDKDGSTVSVVRAKNDNDKFVIGKFLSRGDVYINNEGNERWIYSDYYFLQASTYSWKEDVPQKNRVYADIQKIRYVCRVEYSAGYSDVYNVPGFVDESGKCKYSYGGAGESESFEILSIP